MREQEDDNVIPDQGDPVDGRIDLAKELFEKLRDSKVGTYGRLDYTFPDGSRGYGEIYCQDHDHRGPKKYRIGMWFYYHPNDDNPIIPNDYASFPIKEYHKTLTGKFPEILSYPEEVYDEFTFDLGNETVYYKEGIMHITDVDILPSNERNVLNAKYPLKEFLFHIDNFANMYYLENPPTFSEDYSLAMDKAVKKLKTVWLALKKGTYKGMTYEYPYKPTYVVHHKHNRYNKESRIIYPDFILGISTGWPLINGKAINKIDDKELFEEFHKFISNKFQHFGITIS